MAERLIRRVKVRQVFDGCGVFLGSEEETFEPADLEEFAGVLGTLSLDHGVDPPECVGEEARVFKVYEKKVIWLRVKKP